MSSSFRVHMLNNSYRRIGRFIIYFRWSRDRDGDIGCGSGWHLWTHPEPHKAWRWSFMVSATLLVWYGQITIDYMRKNY